MVFVLLDVVFSSVSSVVTYAFFAMHRSDSSNLSVAEAKSVTSFVDFVSKFLFVVVELVTFEPVCCLTVSLTNFDECVVDASGALAVALRGVAGSLDVVTVSSVVVFVMDDDGSAGLALVDCDVHVLRTVRCGVLSYTNLPFQAF